MKKILHSNQAPAAIGPYSHGIQTDSLIFISGQLPIDQTTGEFAGQSIEEQTRQCLMNVKYILESANVSLNHVVKTTVYLKNISDFTAMNSVYAEFFKMDCPARSAFEVVNLPKDALVEIEVIATTNV